MEFGITEIFGGWFKWYIKDNEKKVEITASRYAKEDFVKQLLISLTDIIRDRTEKRFFIFAEPDYTTIIMSADNNDNFIMELAFEHMDDFTDRDIKNARHYCKFETSMYLMKTEFVPTILKAFRYYERSKLMLDYYEENWTYAFGESDSEKFTFPFDELRKLHITASDINIK
ncbi:MAG TPA: hypothetical protein PK304_00190 [Mobilitalea sp.]|nr:hypothetical protein [Mobilitalea sp.]